MNTVLGVVSWCFYLSVILLQSSYAKLFRWMLSSLKILSVGRTSVNTTQCFYKNIFTFFVLFKKNRVQNVSSWTSENISSLNPIIDVAVCGSTWMRTLIIISSISCKLLLFWIIYFLHKYFPYISHFLRRFQQRAATYYRASIGEKFVNDVTLVSSLETLD